jgi:hypothetical protein
MTTALAPDARRTAVLFSMGDMGASPRMYRSLYKKTDGSTGSKLTLEDVPVFRSGTFRDSMGYQHTYDPFHMEQMVSNFDLLKKQNILPDVPVRDGHPGFLLSGMEGNGKVVGWHNSLRTEERVSPVDQQKYTYLLATYDILDEQAQTNIESGLWRNRSSEVGTYISNSEAEFFPVYAGFAYVDIPAVEGLNGFSKTNPGLGTTFSLMMESEEEAPVGVTKHSAAAAEPVEEPVVEGDLAGSAGGDPVVEPVVETPPVEVTEPHPVVVPEEVVPPVVEEGGDFSSSTQSFRINGQPTTDFAAVQAHILTLEGFANETSNSNRRAFVKGLVDDKKITGAQQSTLEKFALGLDAEQYTAWCETYSLAPELGLLQLHAAGSSNTEGGNGQSESTAQFETAREIVEQHKRSGMPKDKIEATPSYKKLISHDPTFTL